MDVTTAQQIVNETIEGRKRWGRMFLSEYSQERILDALVALDEEGRLAWQQFEELVHKDELTAANRKLTAALAREAKQKKQIEKLKQQIAANSGE